MSDTPIEVRTANLVYLVFWILLVTFFLLLGKRWERTRGFRERMLAEWKAALATGVLIWLSFGLAGRGFTNIHAITVTCQAMVGLALSKGIPDFEALPVVEAFKQGERPWRVLGANLLIAVIVVIPAIIIGTVGLDIGQGLFGETNYTQEAKGGFPDSKVAAFFMLLGGAGIAEETPFRLVLLTLVWLLTGRRWLAIVVSALLFGGYHLTPLNGMYLTFLQFPVSQFLASSLIGAVWGLVYVRRGYGTVVLAHTLSNWLPFLIFG